MCRETCMGEAIIRRRESKRRLASWVTQRRRLNASWLDRLAWLCSCREDWTLRWWRDEKHGRWDEPITRRKVVATVH